MKRIVIAGCPGAGKSTAAKHLGRLTGLPVIHLDQKYWQPGWKRLEDSSWKQQLAELSLAPRWIMDGNYGSTLGIRLAAADTLIYLDFSTLTCVTRLIRRTFAGLWGNRHGELPEGCPERFEWGFFWFVLKYRRTHRARDLNEMRGFSGAWYWFETPGQLEEFLADMEAERQDWGALEEFGAIQEAAAATA